MLVSLPVAAIDFESIDCQKYFAALAQGDPRQDLFHGRTQTGTPLDSAATEQFNENKLKWAKRRAELVKDDITELAQIILEAIPLYDKHVRTLKSEIRKEQAKPKPNLAKIEYFQGKLAEPIWRDDVEDTIQIPYGYKDLAHFLKYHTGSKLPPPEVVKFYGGKVGKQLKAIADYHEAFHTELFNAYPMVKWENIPDRLLLAIQDKAIQKYDSNHKRHKFDPLGPTSLLHKPANHPNREHAKEMLKLAKAMSEDETVPLAHQAMLKDHLAYLQRYRLDPGALFIDYVETLRTRPRAILTETD
jgi:hypothetical protein